MVVRVIMLFLRSCGDYSKEFPHYSLLLVALSLAMARDGSSGGVIRMGVITETGIERVVSRTLFFLLTCLCRLYVVFLTIVTWAFRVLCKTGSHWR